MEIKINLPVALALACLIVITIALTNIAGWWG